jgi:hypothetical protein
MKVQFYIASNGNLFDKIIAWWTNSLFSHVEIDMENGMGFSASNRWNCVRYAMIDFNNGNWKSVDVDIDLDLVKLRADKITGKKYDYIGVFLWFVIPKSYQHPKRYWCSEAVAHVLGLENDKISPQRLYEVLTKGKK